MATRGDDVVYRPSDETVLRRVAGEAILVPVRGKLADLQRIYVLNPVGERVWEDLRGGRRTLGELRGSIVERFDVTPPEAEADLREFLDDLEREGLVLPERAGGREAG